MFTTSPRTTLDKLLHDVLRSPDPVRQISMSSSSFEKRKLLFQKFLEMEDAVYHHKHLDQRPLHKRTLQSNKKTFMIVVKLNSAGKTHKKL